MPDQHRNLRISAKLRTPLIVQGYMTFDALLAALLFEKCQDVEKAHSDVPVLSQDGLFYASAAQVKKIDSRSQTMVANLRADHAIDPTLIKKNNPETKLHHRLARKRRSDFGAVLNNYNAINTPTVSWDVIGDQEKIESLVSGAYFIGKKRTAGFGEVIEWTVSNGETDGLIGLEGQPLRPIPADRFTGDKANPLVDTAWRPAYWNPENRAICYAPEQLQ